MSPVIGFFAFLVHRIQVDDILVVSGEAASLLVYEICF